MQWITLALTAGLASNLFNFVNRYALKNGEDSTAYAWWFEVLRLAIFFILAIFNFRLIWELSSLMWLGLLGLVEFISVYLFMKMHALTELSTSSVIIRLRLVWLPVIAIIFIGERLTLLEYLGVIVITFGLIITSSPKKMKIDKGIKIALMFSMVNSLLSVLMKKGSLIASAPVVMIVMSLPSIIFLPLAMKDSVCRIRLAVKETLVKNLLAVFFNVVSMYLLLLAYQVSPASKVAGIYQSTLIFSVLGGIMFLRETKDIKKKLLGSVITIVGVLLITGFI